LWQSLPRPIILDNSEPKIQTINSDKYNQWFSAKATRKEEEGEGKGEEEFNKMHCLFDLW